MRADLFLLADSAQVSGDKLYLLGGGWTVVQASALPVQHPMAIAVGVLLDWNEANRKFPFRVEIRHSDSREIKYFAEGVFEAGRPPGMPPGSDLRVLMAVNLGLEIKAAGPYEARLLIDGQEKKQAVFTVVDRSQPS